MTTMTKKRVADLVGAQLDWAVGFADGRRVVTWDAKQIPEPIDCALPFSSDWSCGGPIIEREEINIVAPSLDSVEWERLWSADQHERQEIYYGPTPLIAAMRAFCASKLGDEVEVPE